MHAVARGRTADARRVRTFPVQSREHYTLTPLSQTAQVIHQVDNYYTILH